MQRVFGPGLGLGGGLAGQSEEAARSVRAVEPGGSRVVERPGPCDPRKSVRLREKRREFYGAGGARKAMLQWQSC